jgi:hypothetical protein
MANSDVENIMEGYVVHDEKVRTDLIVGSSFHHVHKSPLEKRLLFKTDYAGLPLACHSLRPIWYDRRHPLFDVRIISTIL